MDEDLAWSDNPLQTYLALVRQIPVLERDEEIACRDHILTGDERAEVSRKRLVEANLLLVVSCAERYLRGEGHLLELIEKGNAGLLQAIRSLTANTVEPFSTLAAPFIERALADASASVPVLPIHKGHSGGE